MDVGHVIAAGDNSSILTFTAGPKKGSKMGANMEPFGLPNPNKAKTTHYNTNSNVNNDKAGLPAKLESLVAPMFALPRLMPHRSTILVKKQCRIVARTTRHHSENRI